MIEKKGLGKIALGTVQFGMDYGVSNPKGQVSQDEVEAILAYAQRNGLDLLDTAWAYGNSEKVLGQVIHKEQPNSFKIVSKFPKEVTPSSFDAVLNETLSRLQTQSVYAYLAHDFSSFKNPAIRENLQIAKSKELIQKQGVSVYFPEEIEWLFDQDIQFDIVQLPYNVFDQRFERVLNELADRKVEVHVRSAFLQGLLLMQANAVSDYFSSIRPNLEKLHEVAADLNMELPGLLLRFVAHNPNVDRVLFGVTSTNQFQENIESFQISQLSESTYTALRSLAVEDDSILLPFMWEKS